MYKVESYIWSMVFTFRQILTWKLLFVDGWTEHFGVKSWSMIRMKISDGGKDKWQQNASEMLFRTD